MNTHVVKRTSRGMTHLLLCLILDLKLAIGAFLDSGG